MSATAVAVAALAARLNARTVCSYGVGSGHLERGLAQITGARLVCTDFAPDALAQLVGFAPTLDLRLHDLHTDPPLEADLHILYHLDTEFGDADWKRVLARFREPVLFVPLGLLTPRELLANGIRRGRGGKAFGYLRTRAAVEALWASTHRTETIRVAGETGYLLHAHVVPTQIV